MGILYALLRSARPRFVSRFFGKLQIASAGYMGFAHGLADAQKTMGVITLALVTATAAGSFNDLPSWLGFLRMDKSVTAEHCIETIGANSATPDDLRKATTTLESEALRIERGEFREAFLTLSAITYKAIGEDESSRRVAALAKETHQAAVDHENGRILTKIPVIGRMVAAKINDWHKSLAKEMTAAEKAGKNPLSIASKKVDELSPDVPAWINRHLPR